MNSYPKGSEWRKWDLHFHTPSSYDYKDKSVNNETIIKYLVDNQIAVVAITDHHIIDIERIKNLQTLGKDKITVLPGIEFLSDARGSDPIHFIGIFAENCNLEYVWAQIENSSGIKDIKGKGKKHNEVYCDLADTVKLIKELGGIVSIHAGQKANSVENITHSLPHGAAQKQDIAQSVDIFELGKVADAEGYKKSVFPSIKKIIPMIICSDNHDIKNYKLKENCWIKADPTFEGLKQIIFEPNERVRIQKNNPMFDFEKHIFTDIYIKDNIKIFNSGDSPSFGVSKIPINPNMIAIIGGRGTGKSMLTNYISNRLNNFKVDFLNPPQESFIIEWSNSPFSSPQRFDLSQKSEVPYLYISQSEVKEKVENPAELSKEIMKLLNFTEQINFSMSKDEIMSKVREYSNICAWLNHQDNGKQVNSSTHIQEEIKKIEELLDRYSSPNTKSAIENYTSESRNLSLISTQITVLKDVIQDVLKFTDEINMKLDNNQLKFGSLNNSYFIELANQKLKELNTSKEEIENRLTTIKDKSIGFTGDSNALFAEVNRLNLRKNELIEHNRYIESQKLKIKELKSSIYGSVKVMKDDFKTKQDQIRYSWNSLVNGTAQYTTEQKDLIQTIISKRGIDVKSQVKFDLNKLHSRLVQYIDGRSVKNKNTPDVLTTLLGIHDLNSFYDFLETKALEVNTFEGFNTDHLKSIYEALFSYDFRKEYLSLLIEVTYNGKYLSNISVGQRGTVYLCIKLATNAFSEVIVFDQPEDDLDNEFIITDLVGIFRSLKKFRQIIIVTHNANLVVNSDVEQVIVAYNDDESLTYKSGSLENPVIIDEVCRILEGGKVAFEARRNKYSTLNT